MPGLTELLKALGFTTPFIYAAAMYGFFHWLDKKASGPAKKAISGWLEPAEHDKAAVAAAVLQVFDKIYTEPLLAWRALLRSALITVGVTIIVIQELTGLLDAFKYIDITIIYWPLIVLTNILSDYLALFIIRRSLSRAINPMLGLLFGPLLGVVVVTALAVVRIVLFYSIIVIQGVLSLSAKGYHLRSWWSLFGALFWMTGPVIQTHIGDIYKPELLIGSSNIAALLVHLWLPFFALSVGVVKGLNYLLWATKGMRWFIKQGRDHPFDAIGLVAAPLVFIIAVAIQMLVSK
jgi:hypothetical protein